MKILVMGTGGVGGYYGGLLAQQGNEVTFISRGAHLYAIQHAGLKVKSVHGDFTVEYQLDPTLGFLVPREMRESVWIPPRRIAETRGKATYSRFRRFQVTVDEAIAPPKR